MRKRGRLWIPEAPLLNLKRYREITIASPPLGLAGFFTAELIHARTREVVRRLEFPNMVVDAGLDYAATGRLDFLTYIGVGTSNLAPAATQTDLQAPLARTNSTTNVPTPSEQGLAADSTHWFYRVTRQFTAAQANGNLAEVGVFSAATGGTMFARNLFQDVGGNPTVVTKTSEFELRVTYERRIYFNAADVVYQATIGGVANVDVTARPWGINSSGSWGEALILGETSAGVYGSLMSADVTALLDRTSAGNPPPPAVSYGITGRTHAAYVPGTYYRDGTLEWDATVGNDTGINFVRTYNHAYQHFFPSQPLAKTNTQKLVVNIRKSWGRHV